MKGKQQARLLAAMFVLGMGLVFAACEKETMTDKGGLLSDLQKEYGSKSVEELLGDFETQLGRYDRTINELTAQARFMEGQAREVLDKNVETLKSERDGVATRIEELKSLRSTTLEDVLRYLGLEETYKKINEVVDLFQ